MDKLLSIYYELGFNDGKVLSLAIEIFVEYTKKGRVEILHISKTGDNELLLYTVNEGNYSNIIIDEDADVEFLYVSKNRKSSYSELYTFNTCDVFYLATKL